tara:strand:- start:42 stop:1190 length:1149 start_codon:yes stop_codon:yes gene_type:complete
MKKIGLYLSVGPHSGGSYQYCLSVIKYLRNLDKKLYKIKVFTTKRKWKNRFNDNFKIINLNKETIIDKYLNYLCFFLPNNISKIIFDYLNPNIKILNNSGCDLIIFPSQEHISSKINVKSITTIHDLMHRYERRFKEYDFFTFLKRDYFYKQICNYTSKIIVDSEVGKKHVIKSYNINQNKIIISPFEIPEYLLNSKIVNIYKKYNIPKKKFIFYPAQFWEHKNHLNLIKAFNLLQKEIKNINLVLVGKEKNNLNNTKKKILDLGLTNKIFILGYVDENDMYTFYKKASLTSFVSFCGPTNIPPIEAMHTGCPLICSNVYGMKKQVKKGALFINPNSHKDIYKKMLIILKDKKMRKKIINCGFNVMKKNRKKKFLKSLNRFL